MREAVRVAVTGGAGQIGYSLLFRIAKMLVRIFLTQKILQTLIGIIFMRA